MNTPYPTAVRGPGPGSFFCAPYPGESKRPSPQTRNERSFRSHVGSKRDVRVEYPPTHILSREPTTTTTAPLHRPQINGQTPLRSAENSYEGHRPRWLDGQREFQLTWPTVIEFTFYFASFSFMHYSIYTFWSRLSYCIYLGLLFFRVFLPVVIEYRNSIWRAFKYFVVDLIISVVGPFLSIIELMVLKFLRWIEQIIALSLLVCKYLAELLVTLTVRVFTPVLDICLRISNSVSGMIGSTVFWFYAVGVALTVSWVMEALIENQTVSHTRHSG